MKKHTKLWLYSWVKNKKVYVLGVLFFPIAAFVYTLLAIFVEKSFSWFQAAFLGVSVFMNMVFLFALREYYKSTKN